MDIAEKRKLHESAKNQKKVLHENASYGMI